MGKTEQKTRDQRGSGLIGRLSIRSKLLVLVMVVSSSALVLVSAAFVLYQQYTFRQRLVKDSATQARMLAENCIGALSFRDRKDAQEVLNSLRAKPDIAYAALYQENDEVFAAYRRPEFSDPPQVTPVTYRHRFEGSWLLVKEKIVLNDTVIGSVFLQTDLRQLDEIFWQSFLVAVLASLGVLLLAFFISARLQGLISAPITHLAKVAETVSRKEDYRMRASKKGEDEIGDLTDAFNNMLDQVEKRDLALRESEELLRAVFESTGDGMLIVNAERLVAGYNQRFASIWQLAAAPLEQTTDRGLFANAGLRSRDSKFFWTGMDELYNSRDVSMDEVQLEDDRTFERFSSPLIKNDEQAGRIWSFREITYRKRADVELKQLRHLLSNIIDSMPSVLVGVDTAGRITQWNREAEKLTGISADVARRRPLADVAPRWAGVAGRIAQAIREGKPQKEQNIRSIEGQVEKISDITVYPLISGNVETVEGVVIRVDDVTERVKLDEQLRHAQKLESVGRLAGSVAHDLNNLLSPMLGYAQLLRLELEEGDPQHTKASEIEKAALGARALVQQLLAFSRKQVLKMKVVDLDEVIANFTDILQRTVRPNIKIQVTQTANLMHIKADVTQLEQILMNLVVNAQDAVPEGGTIAIATANVELGQTEKGKNLNLAPGPYVVFTVSDQGTGMDAYTLQNMFEPFFTTKEAGQGTGLGLATIDGIVKQHHGQIDVHSQLGRGTSFEIFFPGVTDKKDQSESQPVSAESNSAPPAETILVVEDTASVRELVCEILHKQGYQVIDHGNAEDCMKFMAGFDEPVQLLLTDIVMPGINGGELYDRLRAIRPDLRVVYMSGYSEEVIDRQGILKPGVDFIQKPIAVQDLLEKVSAVLHRER